MSVRHFTGLGSLLGVTEQEILTALHSLGKVNDQIRSQEGSWNLDRESFTLCAFGLLDMLDKRSQPTSQTLNMEIGTPLLCSDSKCLIS